MPNDRSRCLSCRALHARCIIDPGQEVCSRCLTLGKSQCVFESVRFKLCKTATIAAQRTDFIYHPSQPWARTNLKLAFVLETGDGLENIVQITEDESTGNLAKETSTSDQLSKYHDKAIAQSKPADSVDATTDSAWAEPLHTAIELLNRQLDESPRTNHSHEQTISATPASSSSPTLSLPTTLATETSPACTNITPLESSNADPHPHTSPSTDILISSIQPLTHREATLIHYFISVVSPWVRQNAILRISIKTADDQISLTCCKTCHDLPKKWRKEPPSLLCYFSRY